MSRVFVVQRTLRRDWAGKLVNDKDISSARRFGELIELVDPQPFRGSPDYFIEMRKQLADFNDDDYILPIGDPTYIGAACALACDANGGRYRVLRWLHQEARYIAVNISLWDQDDEPWSEEEGK